MGCNLVMATEAAETAEERALKAEAAAIADNLEKWKLGNAEEKIAARKFLIPKGIMPGKLYKQEDIDYAWSDDLRSLTENVVRIHKCGLRPSCMCTGTLIDTGIPGLEGRVVLSCAHGALPELETLSLTQAFAGNRFVEFMDPEKIVHLKTFKCGDHSWEGLFHIKDDDFVSLSVEAEPQQGQFTKRIPVSDIYLRHDGTNSRNRFDICVILLGKPAVLAGKIVSGFPLRRMNPIGGSLELGNAYPHHVNLPKNKKPLIDGYGTTGVLEEQPSYAYLPRAIEEGVLGVDIKKAIILNGLDGIIAGLNANPRENIRGCSCAKFMANMAAIECKSQTRIACSHSNYSLDMAAISFNGAKFRLEHAKELPEDDPMRSWLIKNASESLKDARRQLENARKTLREQRESIWNDFSEKQSSAKAMIPFDGSSQVGSGFSGSLIVLKGQNESYDVLGIHSGPRFTPAMKGFVLAAAQRQVQIEEQLSAGSSVAVSVVRRAKRGVTMLWGYVTAFMMFLRHAVTRFQ
ncbi:MAG: hypothetical protein LBB05_02270, partial [Puniceicoccales bacterium]|jgi:hypothetical protein|nr:hypothetical protein [Puniceicoccales bacterium]